MSVDDVRLGDLVTDVRWSDDSRPYKQSERESKVRNGRPPALSRADEWELYCYRKSGISIKTCASMWRVSVPTANRIIAKFKAFDEQVEPLAREFRDMIDSLRDSTLS